MLQHELYWKYWGIAFIERDAFWFCLHLTRNFLWGRSRKWEIVIVFIDCMAAIYRNLYVPTTWLPKLLPIRCMFVSCTKVYIASKRLPGPGTIHLKIIFKIIFWTLYTEFKNYLLTLGFIKFQPDSIFLILYNFEFIIYVLIYFDDIIVTCNQICDVQYIIDNLVTWFSIKDLGSLQYFLIVKSFIIVVIFCCHNRIHYRSFARS